MTEETLTSIVVDTGSWNCKIGLSTEELPQYSLNTVFSETSPGEFEFGLRAQRGVVHPPFRPLISEGVVQNWDLLEAFWLNAFENSKVIKKNFVNHQALVNYYPNSNKYTKERQTQLFFENFGFSQYFAVSNPLLALYSSGRVSGLILDSGHTVTSVVPVVEGIAQYHNQSAINFGGNDVNRFVRDNFRFPIEQCIEQKETRFRVSLDYEADLQNIARSTEQRVLPDGAVCDLNECAIRGPEGLFNPEVIRGNSVGIADLVLNSLSKCEIEIRRDLIMNILVVGGNTLFPDLHPRLRKELKMRSPSTQDVRCSSYAVANQASWIGGAVICKLDCFSPMWISKSDYEENGPSVVHRRCI